MRSLGMELVELQKRCQSQEANWKLQVFLHVFFSASFAHVETQIYATTRFFNELTPATKDGTVCHIRHSNLCNCQICLYVYIYIPPVYVLMLAKTLGILGHCFGPTMFFAQFKSLSSSRPSNFGVSSCASHSRHSLRDGTPLFTSK